MTLLLVSTLTLTIQISERVLTYGKSLDVNRLDASLPHVALEEWMKTATAPAQTVWWIGDCDLKPDPPEPPEGYLVCLRFTVIVNHDAAIRGLVIVGSQKAGLTSQAEFFQMWLGMRGPKFSSAGKLSDLPRLIAQGRGSAR